ncbi:MAG: PspC domain-containing protein [Clostridia bacterium]|nr:PspC domain-containing protein [Clostridia bacterium]
MKFHKSIRNRMLLGVCGGLGETFGIDPNIIRGVFLLLNLLTRLPLFLIYLLLGFLLPYGEAERGNREEETSDFGGSSHDYTPDAPPFDVSGAKDVEFDDHEQK